MHRKALIPILFILCATMALANDSAIVGAGGTMHFMKGEHKSVRMVREWVKMDVYPKYYDVTATFIFKNEGPAASVTMGFPEGGGGGIGDGTVYGKKTGFLSFATWVDNSQLEAKRVKQEAREEDYSALWVKNVPFAKGQTRTVRVRYRSVPGIMVYGVNFVSYSFTGGNWRGKVDDSSLILNFHLPPGFTVDQKNLVESGKAIGTKIRHTGNQLAFVKKNWQAQGFFYVEYKQKK